MGKSLKQLNEELNRYLHNGEKYILNEMAQLDGGITIRNEDDGDLEKFAHFHWEGIHFKFKKECPENVDDLKEMIAFQKEKDLLTNKQLNNLLKILNSKPNLKAGKGFDIVYEFVIAQWELLNERDADYID